MAIEMPDYNRDFDESFKVVGGTENSKFDFYAGQAEEK